MLEFRPILRWHLQSISSFSSNTTECFIRTNISNIREDFHSSSSISSIIKLYHHTWQRPTSRLPGT